MRLCATFAEICISIMMRTRYKTLQDVDARMYGPHDQNGTAWHNRCFRSACSTMPYHGASEHKKGRNYHGDGDRCSYDSGKADRGQDQDTAHEIETMEWTAGEHPAAPDGSHRANPRRADVESASVGVREAARPTRRRITEDRGRHAHGQ